MRTINLEDFISGVIAAVGISLFVGIMVFILIVALCMLFAECKLFSKCGYSWWKAIIPFYSEYVFLNKICGLHWAWFAGWLAASFLSLGSVIVTFVKLFVYGIAYYNLAIRFNKDKTASMIFGALFSRIVNFVYAFGKGEYDGSIPVKESGLF